MRGDSSEMLHNRRRFLDAGHYAPLAEGLAAIARASNPTRFLDAGCGEGSFTAQFAAGLKRSPAEAWGMDVSRVAADMAARRFRGLTFAVASVRELPILDGAITCLLNAFAPSEPHEFSRVLDPAGTLITVRPGEDHLIELRRQLYHEVRSPGRTTAPELPTFEAVERRDFRFALTLLSSEVRNLLSMTPYAWSASSDAHRALLQSAPLPVTAHFRVTVFTPSGR
jgi:23S rRNA (guanine745-N1)-methyltransferase